MSNIDGRYKCSMICEQKEMGVILRHYGVLKMYQDKDTGELKGTMFPTFFWLDSPFSCGKIDGNHFSFTAYFSSPCQQFALEVSGTVQGHNLSGIAKNATGSYVLDGIRI